MKLRPAATLLSTFLAARRPRASIAQTPQQPGSCQQNLKPVGSEFSDQPRPSQIDGLLIHIGTAAVWPGVGHGESARGIELERELAKVQARAERAEFPVDMQKMAEQLGREIPEKETK